MQNRDSYGTHTLGWKKSEREAARYTLSWSLICVMPATKKCSESALKHWQKDKSKSPLSNRPTKLRLWDNESMVCAMEAVGWALTHSLLSGVILTHTAKKNYLFIPTKE